MVSAWRNSASTSIDFDVSEILPRPMNLAYDDSAFSTRRLPWLQLRRATPLDPRSVHAASIPNTSIGPPRNRLGTSVASNRQPAQHERCFRGEFIRVEGGGVAFGVLINDRTQSAGMGTLQLFLL
jgi:hypothetical protein